MPSTSPTALARMQDLSALILAAPPPLDAAWLAHEEAAGLRNPKPAVTVVERQPIYAAECRARNAAMMAPGARDHHLSQGIRVSSLTMPSKDDGYQIPVLRYEPKKGRGVDAGEEGRGEEVILIYIHGGGLLVGEADSEELSCRRLVKQLASSTDTSPKTSGTEQARVKQYFKLYSIGYRLMPRVPAQTCFSDVVSAYDEIRRDHPDGRFVLIGSSSGGELAALLSQNLPPASLAGVLLRCPVTVDAASYMPSQFKDWHTSASQPFTTSLLGLFSRQLARDGLAKMPLETPVGEIGRLSMPRTWFQVCTNDVLYSDGLCYAKLLQDGGVLVKVDVVEGWPHTFWLKAPHLDRALEADEALLEGLAWVLEG